MSKARQTILVPLPGQEMVAKRLNTMRNRLMERLTATDAEQILDDVIKRAKNGDQKAAEFVLTKLVGMGAQQGVVVEERPLSVDGKNGHAKEPLRITGGDEE